MKHLSQIWAITSRQTPIDPASLTEIRTILEGVKSGALKHNQEYFHADQNCDTAHCIAGWKAHQDAVKAGHVVEYERDCIPMGEEEEDEEYLNPEMSSTALDAFIRQSDDMARGSEWLYAQHQWGLTDIEAEALFSSDATLDQQFELVELLAAGLTLTLASAATF